MSVTQAATVIGTFTGASPAGTVSRQILNGTPSTVTTLNVGRMNVTRTGGTDTNSFLPGPTSTLWAFCIEPQQGVSTGTSYTWEVEPLENAATNIGGIGAVKADQIRELLGAVYPWFNLPLTADQAAAIQVAIWEIVRETSGTLNVSNGNIIFSNPSSAAILTLAQTYLNFVDGNGPRAENLFALTNTTAQDLIAQTVPEPATLALAGLALVLLGAARRRR